MKRYFCDTGDGLLYFDTPEEAQAAAQVAIEPWKDYSGMEWCEEVESVCWGEIRQRVVAVDVVPGVERDMCNYELRDWEGGP